MYVFVQESVELMLWIQDTYALKISERRALMHPYVVQLLDGFQDVSVGQL